MIHADVFKRRVVRAFGHKAIQRRKDPETLGVKSQQQRGEIHQEERDEGTMISRRDPIAFWRRGAGKQGGDVLPEKERAVKDGFCLGRQV